jgi:hypothetical protein
MEAHHAIEAIDDRALPRREWLGRTLGALLAAGVAGRPLARGQEPGPQNGPRPGREAGDEDAPSHEEPDLAAARKKLTEARVGPLSKVRSAHYVAIGDAPSAFMRVILGDCELLLQDYFKHFRDAGFGPKLPQRPLVLIVFRDDRSFGRFFRLPSLMEAAQRGRPVQPAGVYDRKTNILHVFDWRQVPMAPRSSHRNTETLAHEGTHQLTFNTGLLVRDAEIPLCIVEGMGAYGESRNVMGHSEFGRKNLRRLEDLARIQRRTPWIPTKELLAEDTILRAGLADRVLLAYAQSWLLIHFAMHNRETTPKFRDYLGAIASGSKKSPRLEMARAHLGDLDLLDRELRRYAVRLQMSV